jgi:GH25 family lysozyme M1 (1,4-beta-N-acetylmuramidase)
VNAYAVGIDVSSNQAKVDWNKARQAGAAFCFIRVGLGLRKDELFDAHFAGAKAAGLLVGAYFVPNPAIGPGGQLTVMLGALAGKQLDLPVAIDVEAIKGTAPTRQQVHDCVSLCLREAPRVGGRLPLVYTRQSYFDGALPADAQWGLHELWAARYIFLSGPWADGRYKFRDWDAWRFWQFSADGNGRGAEFGSSSNSIDLNYFNGTVTELLAYCGQAPAEVARFEKLEERLQLAERRLLSLEERAARVRVAWS